MTAKFDAFKAALEALCIEHGVRLESGGYEESPVLTEASEDAPAGLDLYISDDIPLTPEEQEAQDAGRRERLAEQQRVWAECRAEDAARIAAIMNSQGYATLQEAVEAHAATSRKEEMRVSTDPTDPAYIDDRPRKAWCNDRLIEGWVIADEFRRCVITADGKVHNGSVLIERLSDSEAEPEVQASASTALTDAGFTGMFVNMPDVSPVPMPAAVPAPKAAVKPKAKRRR